MSISRRSFLKTALTASGTLMIYAVAPPLAHAIATKAFALPFLEMDENGGITYISYRSDMGQGSPTGQAQMLFDEMDADWNKLVAVKEGLAIDRDYYQDGLATVGAVSTFLGWKNHRRTGANLREGFKISAAGRWQVPSERLTTKNSVVTDPVTGKTFQYHDLFDTITDVFLPADAPLKSKSQATLIGKPIPQLRSRERVTGDAKYGMDVNFPGLKVAMIERSPVSGGKVNNYDAEDALKIKGVVDIIEVSNGVAIIADGFWAAKKARDALKIEWDNGDYETQSSQSIAAQLKDMLDNPMESKDLTGDAKTLIAEDNGQILTGNFSFPFVAHATMEPMNCTAWVTDEKCEIWAPTQSKLVALEEVVKFLDRNNQDINLHTTLMGGGFGRRAQEDFVIEAVEVSQKSGHPVKLIWTREDDMRHDYYRPACELRIQAKLDDENKLIAWDSAIGYVNPGPYHFIPEIRELHFGRMIGFAGQEPAYKIPHQHYSQGYLDTPMTVGILRGISHGYTNFSVEVMIDRMAALGNRNPLELRAELLKENPRALKVMQALQEINTNNPVQKEMARGYAFAFEGKPGIDYQYYSGHMADVSKTPDGSWKVEKVWVVADHGRVINPNGFTRQIQSSIAFAMSMMRSGVITVKNGVVEQGNFDDYPVSLIGDVPKNVSIKLLDNGAHPMGCGEKMQAGIQPAIANAIEKLSGEEVTGIPIRSLL